MVKELLPSPTSEFSPPTYLPLLSAWICDNIYCNFGLRLPAWLAKLETAMEHQE
jgi:hypothetical protein